MLAIDLELSSERAFDQLPIASALGDHCSYASRVYNDHDMPLDHHLDQYKYVVAILITTDTDRAASKHGT